MSELAVREGRGIALHRIGAMVLRYWYVLISSWPRLLELVYWPTLQRELRLITCGGQYVGSRGGYQSNVVVFATAEPTAGPDR